MKLVKKLTITSLALTSLFVPSSKTMYNYQDRSLTEEQKMQLAIQLSLIGQQRDQQARFQSGQSIPTGQVPSYSEYSQYRKPTPNGNTSSMTNPTSSGSETRTIHPIISALFKATNLERATLDPVNPEQTEFLDRFYDTNALEKFSTKELFSEASNYVEHLNKILTEKGFTIQLKPFSPDTFGVVSILKLAVEWLKQGDEKHISYNNNIYPAVGIGRKTFKALESSEHSNPILSVLTKSGDDVYMTKDSKRNLSYSFRFPGVFGLLNYVKNIEGGITGECDEDYIGAIFPMVNLEFKENVEWLKNMGLPSQGRISQALQQTFFSMDKKGAQARSACAIAVTRGGGMGQILKIDGPFIVWIRRPDVKEPIFTGYITPDHWKKPTSQT